MKVDLKEYMEERDRLRALSSQPGPFVTLSRQLGCEGDKLAEALISKIHERQEHLDQKIEWRYLNKEIMDESAVELKLSPDRVKERVVEHGMSVVGNMFSGFGGQSQLPDEKIIKTVKELMVDYAKSGHTIIVGRGGAAVTQKIPNSLHIKLVAPLEWRIGILMRKHKLTRAQAMEMIEDVEGKRKLWAEHLSELPYNDDLYDLILNCRKLKTDEIVNIIIEVLMDRKMIASSILA